MSRCVERPRDGTVGSSVCRPCRCPRLRVPTALPTPARTALYRLYAGSDGSLPQSASARSLHATRHTWATLALQAGKSVRWVADVLGHSDPSLTLRVYAHAMRSERATSPSPREGWRRDG